jgi:hypothetical protein
MEKMPLRDITGECEGECRNRTYEADKERQDQINAMSDVDFESPYENSPSWTKDRNDPPGIFGGHI